MKAFPEYKDAHKYAAEMADLCKRDCGLAKGKEFGRTVFSVFLLPDKQNRCGHELTCEVVTPGTPVAAH